MAQQFCQMESLKRAEGFLWQTDRQTDICDCRVAFATENACAHVLNSAKLLLYKVRVSWFFIN